jgi:hypothetical protein
MLCKETKLYYFQNQGKHDSGSKLLKWVSVLFVQLTKRGVKLGIFLSSA